jgi:hypothetical protein
MSRRELDHRRATTPPHTTAGVISLSKANISLRAQA